MLDPTRDDLILGVVGTGTMGQGIAQIAAAAGLTVLLLDTRPGAADAAAGVLRKQFSALAAKGRMTPEAAEAASARLRVVGTESDLAPADLVIEAIIEEITAKQDLFIRLESVIRPDAVLVTNTSSLSVTTIASRCARPERVVGFHFFNPVPLMKVVEVIDGERTPAALGDAMEALARRLGHRPVRAADTPGFIVNHAGRGFGTEALRILQDGIAPFGTIDLILTDVAGFRMGPFELMDLTGLDVSYPVMESIFDQFYGEPRFRPSYLLRRRLAAGMLGRKNGLGYYDYVDGRKQALPVAPIPDATPRPVWIRAAEPAWHEALAAHVAAAGWPLDTGDQPGADSLCLLAPLGLDATSAALALGADPSHSVAIDLLFGLDRRRTIMTTPVTRPEFADAALALMAATGLPVSRVKDSPGFVAPRVLASIVNVASEIAQQQIASPADIDAAVALGLGYPKGPLAWGDAIGAGRIVAILRALSEATGDPRYRPSLWLTRRARLRVSLLTVEE